MNTIHFDTIEQSHLNKPGVAVYPSAPGYATIIPRQETIMPEIFDHSIVMKPEQEMTKEYWKAVAFLFETEDSNPVSVDELTHLGYQSLLLRNAATNMARQLGFEARYNLDVSMENQTPSKESACALVSDRPGTFVFHNRQAMYTFLLNRYHSAA